MNNNNNTDHQIVFWRHSLALIVCCCCCFYNDCKAPKEWKNASEGESYRVNIHVHVHFFLGEESKSGQEAKDAF